LFTIRSLQIAKAGRHLIEPNLYLEVTGKGTRRFLLRYVSPVSHRATEAGLGVFPATSLADARARAAEMRALIAKGIDPIVQKREARAQTLAAQKRKTTFEDALAAYVKAFADKGASTIELGALVRRHVAALLPRPLDKITSNYVLAALHPTQQTLPRTAKRTRAAVSTVFNYAIARGLHSGADVASAAVFKYLLPAAPKSIPHRMMPVDEVPSFYARLVATPSASRLCLAF
jgi:hypothetical protein